MGCHTWGYKKVSALSEEYKNNLVEEELKKYKYYWIYNVSKEQYLKEYNEMLSENEYSSSMDEKKYEEYLKTLDDEQKELRTRGFDKLLELKMKNSVEVLRIRGEYYWNITFDYPFRVCGYPENEFRSKSRLLKWLKKYSEDSPGLIGYYDDNSDFVEGYTPELVERIEKFYKEHGEHNLFFNFG